MTKKIYALLLAVLCVGFFSCKDDKDEIDSSSATPQITFAYDEDLVGDLNKTDNLPVVAVIRSEAGLQSVKMQIKLTDNSLQDYKTVTEFFNEKSYSLSESLNFREDYAAFVVTATDRLGRSESSTLNIQIVEVKEPPTVSFSPDKIVFNEITDSPDDMPNTGFVAASAVGIKNLEMWLVTRDGQTEYDFPGDVPEFGSELKRYEFDQLIMYKEGSRGFKVKVTDMYDQVKIATLPVTYVSVPAPVITFTATAPLMADKDEEKNVEFAVEAKGNIKTITLYRVEGTTETQVYTESIPERGTTTKTVSPKMAFTLATTKVKAVVEDFSGKSTSATLKAIVGIEVVESVQLGSQNYTNGVADTPGVYPFLSLKTMTTHPLSEVITRMADFDIKFYAMNGTTDLRLYSMNNADAKNNDYKLPDGTAPLNSHSPQNATTFKKLESTFDFDNVTAEEIKKITGATGASIKPIAAGDIVAFKTASTSSVGGPRLGVIKVVSLSPEGSTRRIITLSIKFPKQ